METECTVHKNISLHTGGEFRLLPLLPVSFFMRVVVELSLRQKGYLSTSSISRAFDDVYLRGFAIDGFCRKVAEPSSLACCFPSR